MPDKHELTVPTLCGNKHLISSLSDAYSHTGFELLTDAYSHIGLELLTDAYSLIGLELLTDAYPASVRNKHLLISFDLSSTSCQPKRKQTMLTQYNAIGRMVQSEVMLSIPSIPYCVDVW